MIIEQVGSGIGLWPRLLAPVWSRLNIRFLRGSGTRGSSPLAKKRQFRTTDVTLLVVTGPLLICVRVKVDVNLLELQASADRRSISGFDLGSRQWCGTCPGLVPRFESVQPYWENCCGKHSNDNTEQDPRTAGSDVSGVLCIVST